MNRNSSILWKKVQRHVLAQFHCEHCDFWNYIDIDIKNAPLLNSFKSKLKMLFSKSHNTQNKLTSLFYIQSVIITMVSNILSYPMFASTFQKQIHSHLQFIFSASQLSVSPPPHPPPPESYNVVAVPSVCIALSFVQCFVLYCSIPYTFCSCKILLYFCSRKLYTSLL